MSLHSRVNDTHASLALVERPGLGDHGAMSTSLHLILGAGVVGEAVADELARRQLPHLRASRHAPATAVPHRRVDALDLDSLRAGTADASHVYLTLGLPYDARVWARDWPRVAENLLQAARENGFRLVMLDNIYAYGPAPLQVPMREDHPQQPPSRKGRVRHAVSERLLRAAREEGLPVLIGRSADFYGPGVRQSILYAAAIERQLQGKAAQWLSDPDRRHSYTYTPDAGRALVTLALDEGAYGRAWHLPTAEPAPTSRELLMLSAGLLGAPARIQVLPRPMLWLLQWAVPILRELREMLYQSDHDYVFSSAAFQQRYPDFRVTPYAEGLAAMVASFRRSGPAAR